MLFLFDITGSMGSEITSVKTQATNLVDSIKNQYSSCIFRTGFVGYRCGTIRIYVFFNIMLAMTPVECLFIGLIFNPGTKQTGFPLSSMILRHEWNPSNDGWKETSGQMVIHLQILKSYQRKQNLF